MDFVRLKVENHIHAGPSSIEVTD